MQERIFMNFVEIFKILNCQKRMRNELAYTEPQNLTYKIF